MLAEKVKFSIQFAYVDARGIRVSGITGTTGISLLKEVASNSGRSASKHLDRL